MWIALGLGGGSGSSDDGTERLSYEVLEKMSSVSIIKVRNVPTFNDLLGEVYSIKHLITLNNELMTNANILNC